MESSLSGGGGGGGSGSSSSRLFPGASGPGSAFVASLAPGRPSLGQEGRRVGSSGLSAGRGELQAARTTALVAAVTTASAGGEDERVRKGSPAGGPRSGQGAREGRGPVERESAARRGDSREARGLRRSRRRDLARRLGHSAPGGGRRLGPAVGGLQGRRRQGRESAISTRRTGGHRVGPRGGGIGGARGLFPGAHDRAAPGGLSISGVHAVPVRALTRFGVLGTWWAVRNLLEGKGIGIKSTGMSARS